jgi:ATP-dependent DNA helicase RecG
MDDIKHIIKKIEKPLKFAARDNFAHVRSLAALEPFMSKQIAELRCCSTNLEGLRQLERLFAGFDALPTEDEKKDRILRAAKVIAMLGPGPVISAPASAAARTGAAPSSPGPMESAAPVALDTPIQFCKGIGPKRAELLKKIGINTVEEALFYIPWRYEDRGNLKKIGRLTIGSFETVMGDVVSAEVVETKRKWVKVFELRITDTSGMLIGSWYNQPFMKKAFKPGQKVLLSGIVKSNPYRGGLPQIDNPDYEIMDDTEADSLIHAGRTVPIYRTTSGLSVRYLRSMMKSIIDSSCSTMPDILPLPVIKKYALLSAAEAISEVHFPEKEKDIAVLNRGESAAHRRMSFEELFTLELGLALRKQGNATVKKGIAFHPFDKLESALRSKLPYRLTGAQERVIAEIKKDMTGGRPMNRLVQGDVGCGKTIVATIAALLAIENGYQACLMAPTEILAAQHYRNIEMLAQPLGIIVRHLVGGLRKKAKETILAEIGSGTAGIVIGTHALIEQNVQFKRLGLAIIDEQHRFGVMQRSTLTSKGYEPDVLVMTATPIPRTLALTVYGDLDVSVIDEMPPGRSPIVTRIYFEPRRREAYQFLDEEIKKGRQVYVVYPLVEETEKSDLKAATEMAAHIQKDIFPHWKVGLLHGRMKSDEKDAAMAAFKAMETQILISTTVIEVGVDVPNATVMVIEHPERFGLAQLHQLRGRVGRGGHQSYCILMGPRMFADEARERLNVFARTTDGFKIAEEDLRLRGPGEFLGTRQSGLPDLHAANIIRDADLLEKARTEAFALIGQDAALAGYPLLRDSLRRRWQDKLGLLSVG